MKKVKEICPKCKTAIEYSTKERVLKSIVSVLSSLLIAFGVIFLAYVSILGVEKPINDLVNADFYRMSSEQDDELRSIAIEVTEPCNGDSSYCYAREIYQHVDDIRYVPSSQYNSGGMYDPIYVYENGGDCKNTANMYVSLLRSIGISAEVSCSVAHKHCISVVPYKIGGNYHNKSIVVDLTQPMAVMIYDGEDEWDYFRNIERSLVW